MSCEWLAHEYRPGKDRVYHEKSCCAATGEACLVDDPLGYTNCTRRTFLLMQAAKPTMGEQLNDQRKRKRKVDPSPHALL